MGGVGGWSTPSVFSSGFPVAKGAFDRPRWFLTGLALLTLMLTFAPIPSPVAAGGVEGGDVEDDGEWCSGVTAVLFDGAPLVAVVAPPSVAPSPNPNPRPPPPPPPPPPPMSDDLYPPVVPSCCCCCRCCCLFSLFLSRAARSAARDEGEGEPAGEAEAGEVEGGGERGNGGGGEECCCSRSSTWTTCTAAAAALASATFSGEPTMLASSAVSSSCSISLSPIVFFQGELKTQLISAQMVRCCVGPLFNGIRAECEPRIARR